MLDSTIKQIFGLKALHHTYGDIGVELECEGKMQTKFPKQSEYWIIVADESLRAGYEYVLQKPIKLEQVDPALEEWSILTQNCKFEQSSRTSNHVHFNAHLLTAEQVYSYLTFYWLVENILVRANGKTREGNIFCLRIKDAEALLSTIILDIKNGSHLQHASMDDYRYSACNLAALRKYGSIELRFLKGYVNPSEITFWVKELFKSFQKAIKMKPVDILNFYRKNTNMTFLEHFFSNQFIKYLLVHSTHDWNELINSNFPYVNSLVNTLKYDTPYITPIIVGHEDLDLTSDEIDQANAISTMRKHRKKTPKKNLGLYNSIIGSNNPPEPVMEFTDVPDELPQDYQSDLDVNIDEDVL